MYWNVPARLVLLDRYLEYYLCVVVVKRYLGRVCLLVLLCEKAEVGGSLRLIRASHSWGPSQTIWEHLIQKVPFLLFLTLHSFAASLLLEAEIWQGTLHSTISIPLPFRNHI